MGNLNGLPVIYPNDAARAVPMATSITLGWFIGASTFILVFAITKSVAVALVAALFFGVIFGLGIYYALTGGNHAYTDRNTLLYSNQGR